MGCVPEVDLSSKIRFSMGLCTTSFHPFDNDDDSKNKGMGEAASDHLLAHLVLGNTDR